MENSPTETNTTKPDATIGPLPVCTPHWSTNAWIMCGIMAAILLISIFSYLISLALSIGFYCYARHCQREHGVEPMGTWRPGWGLLAGTAVWVFMQSFLPAFYTLLRIYLEGSGSSPSVPDILQSPYIWRILRNSMLINSTNAVFSGIYSIISILQYVLLAFLLLPVLQARFRFAKSIVVAITYATRQRILDTVLLLLPFTVPVSLLLDYFVDSLISRPLESLLFHIILSTVILSVYAAAITLFLLRCRRLPSRK